MDIERRMEVRGGKYVIWGAGMRGKLALDFLGETKVAAFIDAKASQGRYYENGIPVISFADYISENKNEYIIVSVQNNNQIRSLLQSNHIELYSLLDEILY